MLEKQREQVKEMFNALGTEHQQGGFNEFSQFCEERLFELINTMSKAQLEYLMGEIETASWNGIDRNNYPTI